MNRRSPLRIYGPWILACVLFSLTALFAPTTKQPSQTELLLGGDLTAAARGKVSSARSFASLLGKQDAVPLNEDEEYLRQREGGYPIHLEIDESTWQSLLRVENRDHYRDRPVDIVVQLGNRSRQPAIITMRGGGSLDMPGKPNFRVRLTRKEWFTEEIGLKAFYLMNMYYDRAEYQIAWTYEMLRDMDMFHLHTQYVRVTVNGRPMGLYLLIEPPKTGIRRSFPNTVAIYRRKRPNVYIHEWSDSVPELNRSLSELRALNRKEQVENPLEAYAEVLDIEKYLRWMAINSILQNFDYLDEPYFFEVRTDKQKRERLELMAWDFDDIGYHRQKDGYLDDPHFWSSLGKLDRAIHRSPELFARYKAVLAAMLSELSNERVEQYMRTALDRRLSMDDGRPEAVQEEFKRRAPEIVEEHSAYLRKRYVFLRELLGIEPTSAVEPAGLENLF